MTINTGVGLKGQAVLLPESVCSSNGINPSTISVPGWQTDLHKEMDLIGVRNHVINEVITDF